MTVAEAAAGGAEYSIERAVGCEPHRPAGQHHNIEPPYAGHRPIVAPAYAGLPADGQAGPAAAA